MTVEDYICLLVDNGDFSILQKDAKLLKSLSSQIKKGVAFTDRQHQLSKEKLIEYKDQFDKQNYKDLLNDLDNLRQPYREINREKSVKIVSKEYFDLFGVTKQMKLAVRFPYSTKMIKLISFIKTLQKIHEYDKNTKTHFIDFTEENVLKLLDFLELSNFELDDNVNNFYLEIKNIQKNFKDFRPGVYNFKLKNVSPNCYAYAVEQLGSPSRKNLALYYDRRSVLGLSFFDEKDLNSSLNDLGLLSQKIAHSTRKTLYAAKDKFSCHDIIQSLYNLKRFPLLIILKRNYELEGLQNFYNELIKFISPELMTVLFRLDNSKTENTLFNNTIKDLQLNNTLMDETKVVFLNNEKLSKPILKNKWLQNTSIILDSFRQSKNYSLFYNRAEIVILYDTIQPTWNNQHIGIL